MAEQASNTAGQDSPAKTNPFAALVAASVLAAKSAAPAEGQAFAVRNAPEIESVSLVEAMGKSRDGSRNECVGANLKINFKADLHASFPIERGEDGTYSIARSIRAEGASPEYLAAIWSGKPGRKGAEGGSLIVGVPMQDLVPIARNICKALTPEVLAAGREAGMVYDAGAVLKRTYVAVSLKETGLSLYAFGRVNETDKSVAFKAAGPGGVWSLGVNGSIVHFAGSNIARRHRGNPLGSWSRGIAARTLQSVLDSALSMKDGTSDKTVAEVLKDFRATRIPLSQRTRRFRGRARAEVAAQAPAMAEGVQTNTAPEAGEPVGATTFESGDAGASD